MKKVSDAAREFVTERVRLGEIRGQTPRGYRVALLRFARDLDDPDIRHVTSPRIRRWVAELDVQPSTVRFYLIVLRSFFTWAESSRLVACNPAVDVADPKIPVGIPRAVHRDDVVKLLDACAHPRLRLIALLMVREGLRAVEVSRASTYDLDVSERTLLVHGKGEKERLLPLSTQTWDALVEYGVGAGGPLVRSEIDPRVAISPGHVSRLMSRLFTAAGLKFGAWDGRSGHALRHSAAVACLQEGGSAMEVRDLLGHSSLRVTDKYARIAPDLTRLRRIVSARVYETPTPVAAR